MRKNRPLPKLTETQLNAFWSQVDKTKDHWFWTGFKGEKGYGRISLNDSSYLVTRIMWYLTTGNDPGNLCVLHRCDTPPCCNPEHLFLGTIADNNKDMRNKMRHCHGESHPLTHLTEKDILAIRASSETTSVLGIRYGVTRHAIGLIKRGKRWAHINGSIKVNLCKKLTDDDVIAIRKSSDTLKVIALKYGVDSTTISKIQLGYLRQDVAPELIRQPRKSGRRMCL